MQNQITTLQTVGSPLPPKKSDPLRKTQSIQIKAPVRKTREIARCGIGQGWREVTSHLRIPNVKANFVTDMGSELWPEKPASGELN